MRIVIWGTYDTGKPRVRILLRGLHAVGVEVLEIHADVWRGSEDKTRIGTLARAGFALRWLLSYPGLVWRYLRAPAHDAVLVPYLGQVDVLVLWPLARLRRRPLVWDMFVSLYDTVVHDRALARARGPAGRFLRALEWLACRAADRVLIDTEPHARRVEQIFGLASGSVAAVPVGAEPEVFPRLPPPAPQGRRPRILFYGQMIPLHGVHTILQAALSERGAAFDWRLIGTGQEHERVAAALAQGECGHVVWEDWVDYHRLVECIAGADICLGIFGTSDKAASVVPNKVFQALSCGRPVITRDSPAMRAFLRGPVAGIGLVPPGDPQALLTAIETMVALGCPVPETGALPSLHPDGIGRVLEALILSVGARETRGERRR